MNPKKSIGTGSHTRVIHKGASGRVSLANEVENRRGKLNIIPNIDE